MVYGASERKNACKISSCEAYTVSGKEGEGLEKKYILYRLNCLKNSSQKKKKEKKEEEKHRPEKLFPF